MKLLMIADDFTGALDTGVQFVKAGAETEVFLHTDVDLAAHPQTEVFVFDTETRHVKAEEAYRIVHDLVKRAREAGFTHFYKKTDSGLRGNIGAEIEALSDAVGKTVAFAPAFPKMDRIVKDGISYIGGVPANESVFSRDPFEPVTVSRISELFRPGFRGVRIFDAETDEDLEKTAEDLLNEGAETVVAGCAGFAEVYAKICAFKKRPPQEYLLNSPVLAVCGSINDISIAQVMHAKQSGFSTVPLTMENEKIRRILSEQGACIIENFMMREDGTGCRKRRSAAGIESARQEIAARFGEKIKELMEEDAARTLVVIGGDTLYAAASALRAKSIRILKELSGGVVLFETVTEERTIPTVSKSGGFGGPDWLTELMKEVLENETDHRHHDG